METQTRNVSRLQTRPRLWLEYAANRKSMRAARMLSDTYDPVWLIEHHVIGWEGRQSRTGIHLGQDRL